MTFTRKINASCDMNKFKADLNKQIMDDVYKKDLVFAKKMKDRGYDYENTNLVCNLSIEEYNSL